MVQGQNLYSSLCYTCWELIAFILSELQEQNAWDTMEVRELEQE